MSKKDNLDAITNLKEDQFKIRGWCSNNFLLLNHSKTKLMIFESRTMHANLQSHPFHFMGKEIIPNRHC